MVWPRDRGGQAPQNARLFGVRCEFLQVSKARSEKPISAPACMETRSSGTPTAKRPSAPGGQLDMRIT
jgi:hypothetical protein